MTVKIFAQTIDDATKAQIDIISKHPCYLDSNIRIMPDCHAGKGCVVGFTSTFDDAIIPNIVGVDLNCGVAAVKIKLRENQCFEMSDLDSAIRKCVPSGRNVRNDEQMKMCNEYLLATAQSCTDRLRCIDDLRNHDRIARSIGTLGGGNHFISLDADSHGDKWLIVHSGSRNLGLQVAEHYQQMAIDYCKSMSHVMKEQVICNMKEEGKEKDIGDALNGLKSRYLVSDQLAYLEGNDLKDYLHDVDICHIFAHCNRVQILDSIMKEMKWEPETALESVHNYIDTQKRIIRKGAVSAKKDEELIIPLNMRDGCIIGRGKGNADWNYSAPHGAGRIMSRTQALNSIDMKDYTASMQGIYTTTAVSSTRDEAPMVYKPMDEIIRMVEPTVTVDDITKPLYNFKASE